MCYNFSLLKRTGVDTQKGDVRMQNTRQQNPMGQLWSSIQSWLFPVLEDEIGALDDKHRQFVAVCELCAPQDHIATYRWAPARDGPSLNTYCVEI
jgi:hypothetical protein